MAWIESHQSLGTHLKLGRLARALGICRPQAVGHLHYLWWWAMDNAPSGSLSLIQDVEVAEAAQYTGDAAEFVAKLTECGWLDDDRKIHDWMDYAGYLLEVRRKDRDRKRKDRGCPTDIQRTSSGHPLPVCRTQPNPTQPNPTKEKEALSLPPNGEKTPKATVQDAPGRSEAILMPSAAGKTSLPPQNPPGRANVVETRMPTLEPIGGARPKIEVLHALWQTLTGQKSVRLDMAAERRWFEFIQAGWGEAELRRVVVHIQGGIKRRERQNGALRLSNLLDPERFNEELGMAAALPVQRPRPPEPEKPAVQAATPEQLAAWASKMRADREKLAGQMRVNGPTTPEAPEPTTTSPAPTLPPDVLAAVRAAQERNAGKIVTT